MLAGHDVPADATPRAATASDAEALLREVEALRKEVEDLRSSPNTPGLADARRRAERMARLQAITSDLASALTSDRVAELIIDHGVAEAGAEDGSIWTLTPAGDAAQILRQTGFSAQALERFSRVPLDGPSPLAEALRSGEPIFLQSNIDYAERFPASEARVRALRPRPCGAVVCLPLVVAGTCIGALSLVFDGPRQFDMEERALLGLIADQCAQALQRARLFEAERKARAEVGLLYSLVDAISKADSLDEVYEPALRVVEHALRLDRSSILLFDADGVMRFKAWHGLSDAYRAKVEGHSPWSQDTREAEPVLIEDTEAAEAFASYRETFRAESIRALAFIPLFHRQRLLGKFMVYSDAPRVFSEDELRLARNIALQVGQAIARKLAEAEIAAARLAAETASRLKDEFLAVVSHELRTPLAAISGWVAILQCAEPKDRATFKKGLDVIDRNARVQTKIIEDILDVSRIISGKLVLDPRPFSLARVISEAMESVRTSAAAKEISISFQTPDDSHAMVGDSDRLRQVVWNLLSNAVKFTPRGGEIEVRLRQEGSCISVSVSDTGVGIDPDFLPYVFERFSQANSSSTRRHGGLGLGLAIVRHLVELHGGHVQAESAGANRGTTFTVTLPVSAPPAEYRGADQKSAEESAVSAEAAVDLSGVRVLLVDDEPDARDVTSRLLKNFGAEVRTAPSARRGLLEVKDFRPHVLVSDIGMPDEDGCALIRRVRELEPPYGQLPAIALSAYAGVESRERARAAGFQRYLAKPTDALDLATSVAEACGRAH